MAEELREYHIETIQHRHGWVTVPIQVASLVTINFVLDTGHLRSAISANTYLILSGFGLIRPMTGRQYSVGGLTVSGQTLPDLGVRRAPALGLIDAEAVLGLDFLRRFTDVHFHVPSGLLTLRR